MNIPESYLLRRNLLARLILDMLNERKHSPILGTPVITKVERIGKGRIFVDVRGLEENIVTLQIKVTVKTK
jgi:hypothetical protein